MEKLNALTDLWFKICVTIAIIALVAASLFLFEFTYEMMVAVAVAWLVLVAVWLSHGGDTEKLEKNRQN